MTQDALALLRDVAAMQTVEFVDGPAGDWEYRGGEIVNRRSDFFRIVAREFGGVEELLIRQRETALVGLLVTGSRGRRRVLLSARAEPGLNGGCQLSTTVQSTPSNYERRHGGAATPYLDEILHPSGDSTVLHDSMQYDWAQHYDAKVKRFRVVETAEEFPAPAAMMWVDADLFAELELVDDAITCDLRVALALLAIADRARPIGNTPRMPEPSHGGDSFEGHDVPIDALRDWTMVADGLRSETRDREVVWVHTRSATREVMSWEQPLIRLKEPEQVTLAVRASADGGVEVALLTATRSGLSGHPLWFPAPVVGPFRAMRTVQASAEGGRFWRHRIVIVIATDARVDADARWIPLGEAEACCVAELQSSVELRLSIALARRVADEGGVGIR